MLDGASSVEPAVRARSRGGDGRLRWVLFQLHWLLGITAGIVLAVMGVTGALMSFQDEILEALNSGVMTVEPAGKPLLTAPEIARHFEAQQPGMRITRITVSDDPSKAAEVGYTPEGDRQRLRGYLDPTDGKLLGEGRGKAFFDFVMKVHRWLALPDDGDGIGRQITGFAAIALIYFALSGLYLRWPKRPLDWRSWLVLDLRKTGRNLYRSLHAVVGGWVLIFYLVTAFTGLWWSYDWYREGVRHALTEVSPDEQRDGPRRQGGGGGGKGQRDAVRPDLALAWSSFQRETAGQRYDSVTASLRDNGEVQFRAKLKGARHDRVTDEYSIDGVTGAVKSAEPYAARPLGEDIVTSVYEIHRGAYFGMAGRIGIMLASLTMPLFTITGFLLYFARRRRKRALRDVEVPTQGRESATVATTLVAFASQTGTAERMARLTANALPDAAALPLSHLDEATLARVERLFVVASTYGEGEPPDGARGFSRRMLAEPHALPHLRYAVLALGDREYDEFCAFGHQIDHWLHASGAERLFDIVEMDGDDADAQRQWQQQLAGLGARTDQPDWAPAPMEEWRLVERRLLNPGSMGGSTFHIALEPLAPDGARWQPGDILEVAPRHDPRRLDTFLAAAASDAMDGLREVLATSILPPDPAESFDPTQLKPLAHREYSIASIASSGRVELIVRQCVADDGFLGLGSGLLTAVASPGEIIKARIRSNAAFHPPADPSVPLILIGNGTGLAGLLAHLRERVAIGGGPAWLFWGERHPDHDAYHAEELERLRAYGALAGIEQAWSRLPGQEPYVQHKVAAAADLLKRTVADGGSIYVCGSVQGMAPEVHQALAVILGDAQLEHMAEAGRYRRDIY